jgi:hypothetical protein
MEGDMPHIDFSKYYYFPALLSSAGEHLGYSKSISRAFGTPQKSIFTFTDRLILHTTIL